MQHCISDCACLILVFSNLPGNWVSVLIELQACLLPRGPLSLLPLHILTSEFCYHFTEIIVLHVIRFLKLANLKKILALFIFSCFDALYRTIWLWHAVVLCPVVSTLCRSKQAVVLVFISAYP